MLEGVRSMTTQTHERITFKDTELLYSATARCKCGAGLAYPLDHEHAMQLRAWVCSRVLKGEVEGVAHRAWPFSSGSLGEHVAFDWAFYKVREETSINNDGAHSTRPAGTAAKTVGSATCPKCRHKWESEPYVACGLGHHWFPGDCPQCGYGVGGHGVHGSVDGPSIDSRYRDVVIAEDGKGGQ